MGTTYAGSTDVSSSRSRDEIEKTISRFGAHQFAYAWSEQHAMVGFQIHRRQVRFALPMPDRNDARFTRTPSRGNARSSSAAEAAYEQAVRTQWRALALCIKAKLAAVEAGIVTFEQEFGMHMVMPDGRTVADHVIPAIDLAYETGVVPPFLAIGSTPHKADD